jgi:hypothetical protein
MMRTWSQIYLLKAIVLSMIILLFTESYSFYFKAIAFDRTITKSLLLRPISYQGQEYINYIVSDGRANSCTKYHSRGSLRQLVNAYKLAYAKYKLTPITIKYQPYDYGAEIQHPGRLKNSKQRFVIVTSLTVGASKEPNSSTGLDYKHINVCSALLPVDGYIEYYEADEKESKILEQKIYLIEAFVSKKYPISSR